jgi:conjugative transfer signal peptidase TraF
MSPVGRRFLRNLLCTSLGMFCLWLLWQPLAPHLVLNQTPSLPRGLYWIERDVPIDALALGELVWVSLPEQLELLAKQRRYLPAQPSSHLLKPILALPPDTWCAREHSFVVRGERIGPIHDVDSQGRALPKLPELCEQLGPDFLLVGTRHARSFDSRYVGPIPAKAVLGRATPIWIWAPAASEDPTPSHTQTRPTGR